MVGECWAINDHVLALEDLVRGIALQGRDEMRDAHAGRGLVDNLVRVMRSSFMHIICEAPSCLIDRALVSLQLFAGLSINHQACMHVFTDNGSR